MATEVELMYAAGIGAVGAGAAIFASYIGLSEYNLPKKLFTYTMTPIFIAVGALVAMILQSTTDSFAPIQALAVGAGWPGILQGMVAARIAIEKKREDFEARLAKRDEFLGDIST
jgi:hypothetical protein